MARTKVGVNKSEAIRNVLTGSPDAKAKEVVERLKGNGIEVSENLVYSVKQAMKPATKKAAPAAAPKPATPVAAAAPAVHAMNGSAGVGASIKVARAAAEKVGGWTALKEIVDAMQ